MTTFTTTANSTSTTTTNINNHNFTPLSPQFQQQEWTAHSRSHTEPVIKKTPDVSPHKPRRSVDASPRTAACRRTSPQRGLPSLSVTQLLSSHDNSTYAVQHQSKQLPASRPRRYSVGPLASPISFPSGRASTREVNSILASPKSTTSPKSASTSPISYAKQLPLPSSIEPRSPPQKRPPASHSSLGIETSNGPPPAISTQRSYSHDKIRRVIPPVDFPPPQSQSPKKNSPVSDPSDRTSETIDTALKDPTVTPPTDSNESSAVPSRNSSVTEDGNKVTMTTRYTDDMVDGEGERTIRGVGTIMADEHSMGTGSDKSQARNEDVFLNIARSKSGRLAAGERAEKRRSRQHGADHSTSTHSQVASYEIGDDIGSVQEPRYASERPSTSYFNDSINRRSSLQARSTAASAHPLDDAGRMRYFDQPSRSSFGYTRSRLGRGDSPESPKAYDRRVSAQDSARMYRTSNLSATRNNRMVSGHDFAEQSPPDREGRRVEGTDSTLSTTAPSTVWDELDDLKSRIRKLELTGKLPTSSAAAISTATVERPRTATTTVTTMSSSPKQGRKSSSPTESTIAGFSSSVHPLLHSALGKAKPALSKEAYQALEVTAADALSLTTMLGNNNGQSSAVSALGTGNAAGERQLRRKADSMCRSLTELCLALTDSQPISVSKQRPTSRDSSLPQPSGTSAAMFGTDGTSQVPSRYQRTVSLEPEERPRTSSRIPSRLEARRTSMFLGAQQQTQSSPIGNSTDHYESPSQIQTSSPTSARPAPNRVATVLRSRRAPESTVGTPMEGRSNETIRPISRAMTEATSGIRSATNNLSLPSGSNRASRESSSPQHPLPETNIRSPTQPPSSIPPRRNYLSAIPNPTSTAPNIQPGNRRYASRYVSSSGSPSDTGKASSSRLVVTPGGVGSQTSVNGNVNGSTTSRFGRHGSGMGPDGTSDGVGSDASTTRRRGSSTSSVKSNPTRKLKTLSGGLPPVPPLPGNKFGRSPEVEITSPREVGG